MPDLKRFERSGLVRKGTRVVADNVVFAQISDYTEYVQQRQRDGVVTTRTVLCSVEYSNTGQDSGLGDHDSFRDGVGEFLTLLGLTLRAQTYQSQSPDRNLRLFVGSLSVFP